MTPYTITYTDLNTAISDIEDIKTELNGKSPTSHKHDTLYSSSAYRATMQEDGNLCVYRISDNKCVWNSQSSNVSATLSGTTLYLTFV